MFSAFSVPNFFWIFLSFSFDFFSAIFLFFFVVNSICILFSSVQSWLNPICILFSSVQSWFSPICILLDLLFSPGQTLSVFYSLLFSPGLTLSVFYSLLFSPGQTLSVFYSLLFSPGLTLSVFYSLLFSPGLTLSALAVSDNGNFVATGSMSEVFKLFKKKIKFLSEIPPFRTLFSRRIQGGSVKSMFLRGFLGPDFR